MINSLSCVTFKRFNRRYINNQYDLIRGLNQLQSMFDFKFLNRGLKEFQDIDFTLFKKRIQEPMGTQFQHKIYLNLSSSPIGSVTDLLILFLTLYINTEVQKYTLSLEQIETAIIAFREFLIFNKMSQIGSNIQITKIDEYIAYNISLDSSQDLNTLNQVRAFLYNCILDTLLVLLYGCCDLIETQFDIVGPNIYVSDDQKDLYHIAKSNQNNVLFSSHIYYLILLELGLPFFIYDERLVYSLITVTFNQLIISQFIWDSVVEDCAFKDTYQINHLTQICYLVFNNLHTTQIDFVERQKIIKHIYTTNQRLEMKVSPSIIFTLLRLQQKEYSPLLFTNLMQMVSLWIKSLDIEVLTQINEMLKNVNIIFHDIILDDLNLRILLAILNELQFILFSQSLKDDNLNMLPNIFIQVWHFYDSHTISCQYDQKVDFWLNYIHKLNERIIPTQLTNSQIEPKQVIVTFWILLFLQEQVIFEEKYITCAPILIQFIEALHSQLEKMLDSSSSTQQLILQSIKFVLNYFDDDIYNLSEIQHEIVLQLISYVNHLPIKSQQQLFKLCWDSWKLKNQKISLLIYQYLINTVMQTGIQEDIEMESQQHQGTRNIFFYSMLDHLSQSHSNEDDYQTRKICFFIQLFQYMMLEDMVINTHEIFEVNHPLQNLIQFKQFKINKSFQNYFHVNNYFTKILNLLKQRQFANLEDQDLYFSMIVEPMKLAWLLSEQFDHTQIEFTADFINYFSEALSLLNDHDKLVTIMDLLIDFITSLSSKFLRIQYNENLNFIMQSFVQINIQNIFFLKTSTSIVLKSKLSNTLQIDFLKQLKQMIIENQYNQTVFREQVSFQFILQIIRTDGNANKVNMLIGILQYSLKFINNDIIKEMMPSEMGKHLQLELDDPFALRMIRKDLFSQYVGSILQNVTKYEDSDNKIQQPSLQLLSHNSGIVLKDFVEFIEWKSFTILFELKLDGSLFMNQGCCKLGQFKKDVQTLFFLTDEDRQQNLCYLTFGFFCEDEQNYLIVKVYKSKLQQSVPR